MPSPKLVPLLLSDDKREALGALARKRTASQALAERARIVLACAEEGGVAAPTGVAAPDRDLAGVGPQVAGAVHRAPDGRAGTVTSQDLRILLRLLDADDDHFDQ